MSPTKDTLPGDPNAVVEWQRPDDRFVPIRACELVTALADDLPHFGPQADQFPRLAKALADVVAQEAGAFEAQLADQYADFNPDRDTVPLKDLTHARTAEAYDALLAQLNYLLKKANFQQLTDPEIAAAVRQANRHSLRIKLRPERIAHLSIWVRGRSRTTREFRDWRRPWKLRNQQIDIFRRLAVIARLNDEPHVIIKLFKDIPVEDVEALLPHAEVEMSWRDRILVLGGGGGMAYSTAAKLLKLSTGALALSRLLWVLLVGAGALVFRTFRSYQTARSRRVSQRTTNLYYQNLSNNAAALQALSAMIAQEEHKEALLAYAFCLAADSPITNPSTLRHSIEQYLQSRFRVYCQFDVEDALETLTRLKLWTDERNLQVLPPTDAIEELADHWRHRLSVAYHLTQAVPAPNPIATEGTDPDQSARDSRRD